MAGGGIRRAGPVEVAVDDIKDRVNQWERAIEASDFLNLPELLPSDLKETLVLPSTVHPFYYQQLRRVRNILERAKTSADVVRQESDPETSDAALTQLKRNLRLARSSLQDIRSDIFGYGEDPG